MSNDKITYQAAINELETIISAIESGDTSVDELIDKVKRASYLMDVCGEKLKGTEAEVQKILDKMQPEEQAKEG